MKLILSDSVSELLKGADELKNQEIKEVDYLVDKLIPRGTLCSLVGESDTGKSSFLRQLAVSVAYGDETLSIEIMKKQGVIFQMMLFLLLEMVQD